MYSNRQIKIGGLISYLTIGFSIVSGLIYTPWMISIIGQSNFGLYTLATSLVTMVTIDLGLSSAVTRFISKYRAESLGSFYIGKHTGTFGEIGVLSFNGNIIIATGVGGMLLFHDDELEKKAKHITTQAKVPHRWEFVHDEIGYNSRMPNINAALGLHRWNS